MRGGRKRLRHTAAALPTGEGCGKLKLMVGFHWHLLTARHAQARNFHSIREDDGQYRESSSLQSYYLAVTMQRLRDIDE